MWASTGKPGFEIQVAIVQTKSLFMNEFTQTRHLLACSLRKAHYPAQHSMQMVYIDLKSWNLIIFWTPETAEKRKQPAEVGEQTLTSTVITYRVSPRQTNEILAAPGGGRVRGGREGEEGAAAGDGLAKGEEQNGLGLQCLSN